MVARLYDIHPKGAAARVAKPLRKRLADGWSFPDIEEALRSYVGAPDYEPKRAQSLSTFLAPGGQIEDPRHATAREKQRERLCHDWDDYNEGRYSQPPAEPDPRCNAA